jgi:hypothetical protein
LASLLERAMGTVVEPLAVAGVADLDRPALARLTGGSIAIGLPPRRGWALARFVALWTGFVAAMIAGARICLSRHPGKDRGRDGVGGTRSPRL